MTRPGDSLLQTLHAAPVCGVAFANVSVLRLDLLGGKAPGNKLFKLQPWLEQARRSGVNRLVSFGGAWSNHLHALAAVGAEQGFETLGLVRAGEHEPATAMLEDAARWGMRIERIGRTAYRQRNDPHYLSQLQERLAPCVIIPEGGASPQGARACREIARLIRDRVDGPCNVVLGVGTGTTLAGVIAGLDERFQVTGVSALRGAPDLGARVERLLESLSPPARARWRILHDYHAGGFARVSDSLREFICEFEAAQQIPLDPVYTAKVMYAVQQLQGEGRLDDAAHTVVVHTGGLQGRRGYSWLGARCATAV